MSEAEAGWIAGFIDGEGSIILYLNKAENRIKPIISIGITAKEPVEFLKSKCGGSTYFMYSKDERWKDRWNWQLLGSLQIQELLTAILPYLRVKKAQAQSVLKWLHVRKKRGGASNRQRRTDGTGKFAKGKTSIPEEELNLVELMHKLNKRGRNGEALRRKQVY